VKAYRALTLAPILLALVAVPADRTNANSAVPVDRTNANSVERWMRWELGNLGLSLELPGEPKMRRLPLPQLAQQIIQDHMAYQYNNDQMGAVIIYVLLKGGTQTEISKAPSIIASVAIASLAANPSISNIRSSTEESGNKVLVKASFNQDGITKEIDGFILVKGRRLWLVMTARVQGDDSGRASTQRVLDSVRLE
jgi:hypothetical protein